MNWQQLDPAGSPDTMWLQNRARKVLISPRYTHTKLGAGVLFKLEKSAAVHRVGKMKRRRVKSTESLGRTKTPFRIHSVLTQATWKSTVVQV